MIATVSGVVGRLPPSVRDFQVYRFVKFDCNSTRDAASEFDLSQTRVRQIVARVVEFFAESVPHQEGDDERAVRLVAAERLAREQLEYLYHRTMMAFDATQREDEHGNLLPGKVAYLAMAGRLVLWMSKVPLHAPLEFREDEEQNAREEAEDAPMSPQMQEEFKQKILRDLAQANAQSEKLREQARINVAAESESVRREVEAQRLACRERLGIASAARTQQAESDGCGASPPNVDCSVAPVSRGEKALPAAEGDSVSLPAEGSYLTLDEIKADARREFLRPAHPVDMPECKTPLSGERMSPADEANHAPRQLNRKQRRARERTLRRALAKR